MAQGWNIYVVKSDATLNRGLVYTGNVTLILCDGARLTVKGGIWHYGSELTIYGQNGQSGGSSLTVIRVLR